MVTISGVLRMQLIKTEGKIMKTILSAITLMIISSTAQANEYVVPQDGLWDNGSPGSGCAEIFEFNRDYTKMYATTVNNPNRSNGCIQNGTMNVVDCSYLINGVLACGNGKFLSSDRFYLAGRTLRPL
jgi:hypothetical protein